MQNSLDDTVRKRIGALAVLEPLLPAIQRAAEPHPGVFLVGGAVRDLLLGVENVDVDIAVEGNALEFARQLASELGGEVREHERFQTAVVRGPSWTLDVAASRNETYSSPGALPRVSPAGIGDDLARRDITVNAMASSLKADSLGVTVDPFGGFGDLRDRCVRVLHDSSFNDDPTRLLRVVRYAARLGFGLDPHTVELIEAAIDSDRLRALESGRVRDELCDLLRELEVDRSLELLESLGLDRALHPRLNADRQTRELVAQLESPTLRLGALCADFSADELGGWLDRLNFSGEVRDAVIAAACDGPQLGRRLAELDNPRPSQLHSLLAGQPDEALAIAATTSAHSADLVEAYREKAASVSLEISGDDLIAAGVPEGPQLGRALREVLALELDGALAGREEQLAAALRILGTTEPGQ